MQKKSIFCMLIFITLTFTGCSSFLGENIKTTDISEYSKYLGDNGKSSNEIFPKTLPASAKIEDFCYNYVNVFDPNTVSYLVYTCNNEDYQKEMDRLGSLTSYSNYLIYSAKGFNFPIATIYSNDYNGYIYALADKENNKLIYVEITFCNYFSDINYEKIIDKKYLPIGFDAKQGNPTRKAFDAKQDNPTKKDFDEGKL